ncbi:MAG: DMT family transporter [Pirellulales bacterium]|nr:DMT family transporter [Pirellulales bacterium]
MNTPRPLVSNDNTPPQPPPAGWFGLEPATIGTLCCFYAAVGYTTVNTLLRFLSVRCDQPWTLAIKETVTVLVLAPWVIRQARQGWPGFPGWRGILVLALAGVGTQLIGNLSVLWALSVIGLSITVPVSLGVNLVASAVLGWVVLGERVSLRAALVVAILIVSIVILSVGAEQTNRSIAARADVATGPLWVTLAVLGAGLAGVIYALLGVVIRRTNASRTHPFAIVFIITVMGTLTLGPVGCWRGVHLLQAFSTGQLALVVVVGLVNLTAFLAVTRGLQLTPVVRANVMTASQVAMGVLLGMIVFGEAPDGWLAFAVCLTGVCLTIVGIVLLGRSDSHLTDAVETPV